MLKKIYYLLIILLIPVNVLAWNATGHRLVTTIAYHHLKPQTKVQVNQMLQYLGYPATEVGFAQAGLWMDVIKIDGITLFNHWHYINVPYTVDHIPVNSTDPQNVQWAIDQSRIALLSPHLSDQDKAFFLRFLLHLVADVHQPMHCVSLYSSQFPNGDRGGTLYQIQWFNSTNLHRFWDQGLGLFVQKNPQSAEQIIKMAQSIEKNYPLTDYRQQANDLATSSWIQACYTIAKTFSYTVPENAKPDKNYITEGRQIVNQQIALAGYRLAHLVNSLID